MRLQEFRETLQKLIPNPPSWLFVCDRSPFHCEIFLIGANPARTPFSPFWKTYWTDEVGLNKTKLLADLRGCNGKFTKTRKKIEQLRGRMAMPLLDTNVYSRNTPRQRDLTRDDDPETDMINFLLDSIQPNTVVAHGRRAFVFFKRIYPTLCKKKLCFQDPQRNGVHFEVLYCTHLSRIGHEEFNALVSKLRRRH